MIGPAGYRSCLARHQPRTAPTDEDLQAMRRAAWCQRGVIMLRPEDVREDWTRQALINGQPAVRPPAGRRLMSRRVKPHKVKGRQLEEVREKDPDGRIVYHHRTLDTLGKMLRAGTITPEMREAAQAFQANFIVAQLDTLRALPVLRVPGMGRDPDQNERQLHANRRVHEAMQALGGISSPAGSCVWHVVGLQRSVREWAIRQGWGGRQLRQEQAQGILGMLAAQREYALAG